MPKLVSFLQFSAIAKLIASMSMQSQISFEFAWPVLDRRDEVDFLYDLP